MSQFLVSHQRRQQPGNGQAYHRDCWQPLSLWILVKSLNTEVSSGDRPSSFCRLNRIKQQASYSAFWNESAVSGTVRHTWISSGIVAKQAEHCSGWPIWPNGWRVSDFPLLRRSPFWLLAALHSFCIEVLISLAPNCSQCNVDSARGSCTSPCPALHWPAEQCCVAAATCCCGTASIMGHFRALLLTMHAVSASLDRLHQQAAG